MAKEKKKTKRQYIDEISDLVQTADHLQDKAQKIAEEFAAVYKLTKGDKEMLSDHAIYL